MDLPEFAKFLKCRSKFNTFSRLIDICHCVLAFVGSWLPSCRMSKQLRCVAVALVALAHQQASAWTHYSDTTLNVTEIVTSMPEKSQIYLGSPSVLRLSSGTLLATHDWFGAGTSSTHSAIAFQSFDNGQTWSEAGTASPIYWATLFTRPNDTAVYMIGSSSDGSTLAQVSISKSVDDGTTWTPAAALTNSKSSFSTGPTPVLAYAGRLWRAFEHNVGAGWGSGYASVVISAPIDAPDLLDASAWTLSGELNFSSVAGLVPASWTHPNVTAGFGWLEGNAVMPVNASDDGINIILRVNTQPTANKAALLHLAGPGSVPEFVSWINFPGGMSKFTIRRDAGSAAPYTNLYVTLSNNILDDSVTYPPSCAPYEPNSKPVPCCGFLETCYTTNPGCLWCHAGARNNLTFSVSPDLSNWTVVSSVLSDDTGVPTYISVLGTGFQYADWQFDGGVDGNTDIIFDARAGYRGANNYHNANRHLFGIISDWRGEVARVAPHLMPPR